MIEDLRHALADRSGRQRCERIRSGGGGRRADSSRGGAGKTDLHTSTISAAIPPAQRLISAPGTPRELGGEGRAQHCARRQAPPAAGGGSAGRTAYWLYRACN